MGQIDQFCKFLIKFSRFNQFLSPGMISRIFKFFEILQETSVSSLQKSVTFVTPGKHAYMGQIDQFCKFLIKFSRFNQFLSPGMISRIFKFFEILQETSVSSLQKSVTFVTPGKHAYMGQIDQFCKFLIKFSRFNQFLSPGMISRIFKFSEILQETSVSSLQKTVIFVTPGKHA